MKNTKELENTKIESKRTS